MKSIKMLSVSLLMLLFSHVAAQKQYFQTINGDIQAIKIKNTARKCCIDISSSHEKNEVVLFDTPKQGLFTVKGDTLTVESENGDIKEAKEIHINLKTSNRIMIISEPYAHAELSINGNMPFFQYRGGKYSQFEMKNPNNNPFAMLDVFLDSNAAFTTSDYITADEYLCITVRDNGHFECGKISLPKRYCKIESKAEGVTIDNKPWTSYPHTLRNENSLPNGVESWQFYHNIDAFWGMLTNKNSYLGTNTVFGCNFDMMFQYNFAYQHAFLFGLGIGVQSLSFSADGYKEQHGITTDDNFNLSFTANTWRLPVIYRYYLDDNLKAPSVDFGLIPYWKWNTNWERKQSMVINNESLSKFATTFSEMPRTFQLDIYAGLNLGRKWTLYGTFGLLPVMEKSHFDNMRMFNVGIKYRYNIIKNLYEKMNE